MKRKVNTWFFNWTHRDDFVHEILLTVAALLGLSGVIVLAYYFVSAF